MPAPLSLDLRSRIVAHHNDTGDGSILCGRLFRVGEATVRRLFAALRNTNSLAPKPATGGITPKIPDDSLDLVKILVAANNDLVMDELREQWFARTGTVVSTATMGRALKRAGLTLKKRPGGRQNEKDLTSSKGARRSERCSTRRSSKRSSTSTNLA